MAATAGATPPCATAATSGLVQSLARWPFFPHFQHGLFRWWYKCLRAISCVVFSLAICTLRLPFSTRARRGRRARRSPSRCCSGFRLRFGPSCSPSSLSTKSADEPSPLYSHNSKLSLQRHLLELVLLFGCEGGIDGCFIHFFILFCCSCQCLLSVLGLTICR